MASPLGKLLPRPTGSPTPTIGGDRSPDCGPRRYAAARWRTTLRRMDTTERTAHGDPHMPAFTTATAEEIALARKLRDAIVQRYLAASPRTTDPYWCIGAD